MNWVKKLASVVFSLLIILAITGYVAVRNFDLNKYKSYASEMVERELGRKLEINGDASVGISLVPTIVINDVALANPDWAQFKDMLVVKQLEVKFAILPLLKKQIVIDKVNLIGPEIYLEVSPSGQASWDFGKGSAKAPVQKATTEGQSAEGKVPQSAGEAVKNNPAAALLAGFTAKSVVIDNGLLQYYDAQTKKETVLQINNITMKAPSPDEQMTADFDVLYNKEKVKGSLELGSLNSFIEGKDAYPFKLAAEAMGINMAVNGSAADIMKNPRYALEANIYNPAGNLNAPETTLKTRVDGDVNQATAQIEVLNIVNNLITGKVTARWSGNVPQIDADLKSDLINLQNFSQNSNFAIAVPAMISEAQASEMVPDTAIPYKELKQVNAKANLNIGKFVIAPGMEADNIMMKAELRNGLLNVNPLRLKFGGGNLDATMSVNADSQSLAIKAVTQNMLLQNLYQEFAISGADDFGISQGGKVDMDINLNSRGATYRQVVQNMNGLLVAIVGESKLQTGKLQFMSGNFITQLLHALNIDTSKKRDMDLTCAVVRADFANGKATFPKGIAFNAKQLTVVADGKVNLQNDKIDFSIKPFSGKLVDTNVAQALASFVKVSGTVQDPKIVINDKEALKAIVGVAATGGTAYLGSKLLLDADSSPCYTALAGTPYASRFPKPTGVQAETQNVYQGADKAVKDGLKDIKNTAKDLLGSLTSGLKSK